MKTHHRSWFSGKGLLTQLSLMVVLAGLLATIAGVVLASILFHHSLLGRQQSSVTNQALALSDCSARVSIPRVAVRSKPGKVLGRIADAALAGTAGRGLIVIDRQGNLQYASSFSAPLLRSLLLQLRHDFAAAARPRGATTIRSFTMSGYSVADIATSCAGSNKNGAVQSAGILVAETESVIDDQWHDDVAIAVIAGIAGLILLAVFGSLLVWKVIKPVHFVSAAALAVAAGELDRAVVPEGPAEAHDFAVALNTMQEEASRRQRVDHDLLANISHELAASLGLIQGYTEGLADGVIEGEQQRMAALQAIAAESERLKRLTGNLLDLALIETGEIDMHVEEVPVNELLTNLLARFSSVAQRHGVTIALDVPPALPTVRTDGFRLEQVLVNLLSNAIRHTPEGGTITLSARPAGAGVNLAIADTGVGIPPEELSRIWERFYQVDKARDRRTGGTGLGLGLAICHSTIKLLGGRIEVESVQGAGTTFRIWLPLKFEDKV